MKVLAGAVTVSSWAPDTTNSSFWFLVAMLLECVVVPASTRARDAMLDALVFDASVTVKVLPYSTIVGTNSRVGRGPMM
jgi:hypothetical protein